MFMVALAVGTLAGSGILVLVPEVTKNNFYGRQSFFLILEDIIPIHGAIMPLFWTLGDISLGFQSPSLNIHL